METSQVVVHCLRGKTLVRRPVINGMPVPRVTSIKAEPLSEGGSMHEITMVMHGTFDSVIVDDLPAPMDVAALDRKVAMIEECVKTLHACLGGGTPTVPSITERTVRHLAALRSTKNALLNILGAPASRYDEQVITLARNLLTNIDNTVGK